MDNGTLLKELLKVLDDMDFFRLYPSSKQELRQSLSAGNSNGIKIRAILTDPDVQEYLFPGWRTMNHSIDPVEHYIDLRRSGRIT